MPTWTTVALAGLGVIVGVAAAVIVLVCRSKATMDAKIHDD